MDRCLPVLVQDALNVERPWILLRLCIRLQYPMNLRRDTIEILGNPTNCVQSVAEQKTNWKKKKMNEIGITERGDAALDLGWLPWVRSGKPTILITKNPDQLLRELLAYPEEAKNFNVIIHTTITGFGGSRLEPNVPNQWISIAAYKHLIDFYSIDRVVLRIDPIIPTDEGLRIAQGVYAQKEFLGRARISFIDLYPHVKMRFEKAGIILPWKTFHAPLELRERAYKELGRPEICGEPDFKCTGCVSEKDCITLGVKPQKESKGQRKYCACLMNKKELLNSKGQCGHGCVYCYWGNNG